MDELHLNVQTPLTRQKEVQTLIYANYIYKMDNALKSQEDSQEDNKDDINALSDNKVDVEIEPDVKSNDVVVQICSCSLIFNCFSSSK